MSCGLNYTYYQNFSGNYWWWDLSNGSTVYCEYYPQCEATFDPDPDIAGLGVIIAFILTAWMTIVVAVINAFYPTRDTYRRLMKWYAQRHHPQLAEPEVTKPQKLRSWLEELTDRALLALCDIQLITGTAILVAGFAQLSTISFYHRAMITNLSTLTLNSFWASRSSGYRTLHLEDTGAWDRVRAHIRSVCIFIAVVLMAVFNAIQIFSEDQDWDFFASGKCYRYHDYSDQGSEWLWIAGLSVYALTLGIQLLALLVPHGGEKINQFLHLFANGLKALGRLWVASNDELLTFYTHHQNMTPAAKSWTKQFRPLSTIFRLVGLTVLLMVGWSTLQFWAIWSSGHGFQAAEVVLYSGFTAWNTFDIIDQKVSNEPLLNSSESKWGFGQILPLYMLLMLGFNLFDVAQDTFEEKKAA